MDEVELVARALWRVSIDDPAADEKGYPGTLDYWMPFARAAIAALPLKEWLAEWEGAEGMVDQEFRLSSDPPLPPDAPLNQFRALVAAIYA